MNYEFPVITHIDEIVNVIKDSKEFIVAEREWGYVVNYLVAGPDTFPSINVTSSSQKSRDEGIKASTIRRECRGMIFGKDGRLISRPFHKFFNVNERDETRADKIDLEQRHVILEKLDGSMIRAIPMFNGTYRLATKMGITDVSVQAEGFVSARPNYDQFFRETLKQGYTALFEWCSRQQRIVIDYPEDRLVLLAMRDNHSGSYLPVGMLRELAVDYNLDLVREYPGTASSMEQLLEETCELKGQEGWIIRFNDGHMLKLKGSEYVTIHKAKDRILRENGVIGMILDEKTDDVKPFLPKDDRCALERYEGEFWQGVNDTAGRWQLAYADVKSQFGADRKGFALDWAPKFESNLRGAIFKAWDDPQFDFRAAVIDAVRKNLGTQARVNEARHLWGDARWQISCIGEE